MHCNCLLQYVCVCVCVCNILAKREQSLPVSPQPFPESRTVSVWFTLQLNIWLFPLGVRRVRTRTRGLLQNLVAFFVYMFLHNVSKNLSPSLWKNRHKHLLIYIFLAIEVGGGDACITNCISGVGANQFIYSLLWR